MAATKAPGLDVTRKLGPLPIWAWAAIGVAVGLWYRNKKSSSSTTTGTTSSTQTGYSALAMRNSAAYGSSQPIGYSDYSSGADLAGVLQRLSGQITSLGGGNSGTNQSAAVSPGNTQTGAANQTSPAAAYGGIPGYMAVKTPAEGSAYLAAGQTVYALPAGAQPTAGALIPYAQPGKPTIAVPAHSTQYVKVS